MGEDADFFDGSVADRRLVEKLRTMENPPADPKALAEIIDRRCGRDIMFNLYRFHREYAGLRRRTLKNLTNIQKYARKLLMDRGDEAIFYPFSLAVDDVLAAHVGFDERSRMCSDAIAAVQLLEGLPLRVNLTEFAHPPELDARVTEIARAVVEYWESIEAKPFRGRVDREPGSPTLGFKRGSAASLVDGVFRALGINFTPSQLETHLEKVRQ